MTQLDNPFLASLVEQDQEERGEYLQSPSPEKWQEVTERDKIRRARVIELMQGDKLHTANDYFGAGLIMLHGDTKAESTLAHVFAMAAGAKGNPAAAWLSAVTLDNMMIKHQHRQVFDTQCSEAHDGSGESRPADELVVIPESMRKVFAPYRGDEEPVDTNQ